MSKQSAAGFCEQETRVTQLLSSPGHVSQKELTPYRKPRNLKLRIDPKKSQKLPFCSVFIPTDHKLRIDFIQNTRHLSDLELWKKPGGALLRIAVFFVAAQRSACVVTGTQSFDRGLSRGRSARAGGR